MIDNFSGEYEFLSNFFRDRDDDRAPGATVEHRFQAAKTSIPEEKQRILAAATPGRAKRHGRRVALRKDWGKVRDSIMLDLLREKFADPELGELLVATYPHELVEGNNWHDYYWGVCNGRGENRLGQLLMQVRDELRAGR